MRKILLCSPFQGPVGGISRWTGHIMEHYNSLDDKAQVSLYLFSLSRSEPIHANTNLLRRVFLGIKDYLIISISFINRLFCLKPDVVHLVSSGSLGLFKDIFILLFSKVLRKKTIIHFRFGRIPEIIKNKTYEYYLLLCVFKLSNLIILIDDRSFNAVEAICGDKTVYLPNPLNPSLLDVVLESKVERKDNLLLYAGHVVPTKGVFELIQATKHLEGVTVRFVGHYSPDMKIELDSMTKDAICNYEFLGELDYKSTIENMLSSSIFVFPSYTEGFPNVILEAMACSCAIIASNVGAIPEMLDFKSIKPGGSEVFPKDVNALKNEIVELLNDKNKRVDLGKIAQNKVVNTYSMKNIWSMLNGFWIEV